MVKFMGIDVGIKHLGCSILNFDETQENSNPVVEWFELIDLMEMKHQRVPFCNCTLSHTSLTLDRVQHFIQEYYEKFEMCDYIYIERQPITGITSVEQLLVHFLRPKSILVSPNAIHKYFDMPRLDYDGRKEMSLDIAKKFIQNEYLMEKISSMERSHDISDSVLIALFGSKDIIMNYRKKLRWNRIDKNFKEKMALGIDDYFDSFSYKIKQ